MKHLSLILALALIFACASLASCGGETESSTADTSAVESSEASTSETESSEQPKEPQLISRGCEYEVPGGKGYVVKNDQWPANYSADLTDGVANDKLAYDDSWFSFNSEPDSDGQANRIDGVGTVILDLGAQKTVTSARTNIFANSVPSASIAAVGKVVISFSDDGKEFTSPVTLELPETAEAGWAAGDVEPISARYVKLEYTALGDGYHMFINEIEIYGY